MGRTVDLMAASSSVKHEYQVELFFENVSLRKPTIFENNGAILPMMPNDARMRNLTYASPLFVDVRIRTTFIDNTNGGARQVKERLFPNVHLGKIPVMVGSKYCLLHDQKHLTPIALGECAEDYGGYFIVGGGERVIISQERMAANRPVVFRNNRNPTKEVEVIEVKSIGPDNDQVPKSNAVKIMYHPKNPQIHLLRATMPRVKTDIPLWILFRALGVLRDKEICDLIIGKDTDGTFDGLLAESIHEAIDVRTQEAALAWMSVHVSSWSSRTTKQMRIEDILSLELFPHIGLTPTFNYDKACFLAHMTRKVLWVASARMPNDDRDAYPNKLVDLPGFLLANLFRTYFTTKMIKDIRSSLAKEIHSGGWRASGNFEEIVNISNINKVIKSVILEVGLKTSLATGNFGSAKIGGPSKIGVSQVLNRLNYIAGISHLRRISTPIEKTGKLVAPRKLHNTQWGYICPSETPEGHSVGVVKNMSSTSIVSITAMRRRFANTLIP
jgi:DNA-directed RNA polymerase II subunit RPB2